MVSRPACPYCEAIRREQLFPMLRDKPFTRVAIVEFDFTVTSRFESAVNPGPSRIVAPESPRALAKQLGIRLAPTLLFLGWANNEFQELAERLVGYGGRDFFYAYLEERISLAQKMIT
jgi:thioredoxin-related protein